MVAGATQPMKQVARPRASGVRRNLFNDVTPPPRQSLLDSQVAPMPLETRVPREALTQRTPIPQTQRMTTQRWSEPVDGLSILPTERMQGPAPGSAVPRAFQGGGRGGPAVGSRRWFEQQKFQGQSPVSRSQRMQPDLFSDSSWRNQTGSLPSAVQAPVTAPMRTQPAQVMPVTNKGPAPRTGGPAPGDPVPRAFQGGPQGPAVGSREWYNTQRFQSAGEPDYRRLGEEAIGGTIAPRRTPAPAGDFTGPATGAATPSAKSVQKAPQETAKSTADTRRTIGPDTMGSQIFGGPSGNTFVDRGPSMMGSSRLSNSQVGPSGPTAMSGDQAAAAAKPRGKGQASAQGGTRQTGRVDLQDTRRTGAPADMPAPDVGDPRNNAPPPRTTANNAPPRNPAAGSTYVDPASLGPAPQANQPFTGISGTSSTGPAPAATPSPSVIVDPALAGPPPGGGGGGTGGGPAPGTPAPADAPASGWTPGNIAAFGAGLTVPAGLGYLLGDASGSADEQARMAQAGLAGGALGMMGPPLLQGQYF